MPFFRKVFSRKKSKRASTQAPSLIDYVEEEDEAKTPPNLQEVGREVEEEEEPDFNNYEESVSAGPSRYGRPKQDFRSKDVRTMKHPMEPPEMNKSASSANRDESPSPPGTPRSDSPVLYEKSRKVLTLYDEETPIPDVMLVNRPNEKSFSPAVRAPKAQDKKFVSINADNSSESITELAAEALDADDDGHHELMAASMPPEEPISVQQSAFESDELVTDSVLASGVDDDVHEKLSASTLPQEPTSAFEVDETSDYEDAKPSARKSEPMDPSEADDEESIKSMPDSPSEPSVASSANDESATKPDPPSTPEVDETSVTSTPSSVEEPVVNEASILSVPPSVNPEEAATGAPVWLDPLRYANYHNYDIQGGAILELDKTVGRPVFAHLCAAPADGSISTEIPHQLYFHPRITKIIEECFVPIIYFNLEACDDAERLAKVREWFGTDKSPETHMLRILTPDGSRVVVGSDDIISDQDALEGLLMYSLQELACPIPEALYQNVIEGEALEEEVSNHMEY